MKTPAPVTVARESRSVTIEVFEIPPENLSHVAGGWGVPPQIYAPQQQSQPSQQSQSDSSTSKNTELHIEAKADIPKGEYELKVDYENHEETQKSENKASTSNYSTSSCSDSSHEDVNRQVCR